MEKRVRDILDKQVEESQSGFGKGRSCQDHVFTLKQISEKIRIYDQEIYMNCVDIRKSLIVFQENTFGKPYGRKE